MKKFFQLTNKSFDDLNVKTHQELWEKVKDNNDAMNIYVNAVFTKSADMANKYHVVMSTPMEDRHGDIVEQEWDLRFFKKNNVFLDSHNYDSIEHILGRVEKPSAKNKNLEGDVVYCDDNPKGLLAHKMTDGDFLHAVSVGFIPKEFDDKGRILKSELLELSAVSVPANPEALFEKKQKDIEKKQEDAGAKPQVDAKKIEKKQCAIIKHNKLDALKRLADQKENRRKHLYKESLAVIQRLSQREVDAQKRKQMVNRAIKQLLKAKE